MNVGVVILVLRQQGSDLGREQCGEQLMSP